MKKVLLLFFSLMLICLPHSAVASIKPKEILSSQEPNPSAITFATANSIRNAQPMLVSLDIPKPEVKPVTPADETKQETPQIKPIPLATTQPKSNTNGRTETLSVTAYTAFDGNQDGKGITASGTKVRANHTASCPKSLPFGTRLYIPQLGNTYTCEDRGSAIIEGHLDIYIPSLREANDFGRKNLEVIVYGKGSEM